ncbi:hypothetical protein F9B85_06365 [Heliorestis acidaminivorans]|uniref:Uncharacterized protein n=1 Tax=Heliorestis acidaminivorans TaxID=553427 RepID=A0A6I0EZG7_9FIRM|nr:hypothetical protein [Heliorestis acidaminivorans]KAB2952895.1 hypothetical protein F9B85_06365 [Heliorestis acidaminivorans]
MSKKIKRRGLSLLLAIALLLTTSFTITNTAYATAMHLESDAPPYDFLMERVIRNADGSIEMEVPTHVIVPAVTAWSEDGDSYWQEYLRLVEILEKAEYLEEPILNTLPAHIPRWQGFPFYRHFYESWESPSGVVIENHDDPIVTHITLRSGELFQTFSQWHLDVLSDKMSSNNAVTDAQTIVSYVPDRHYLLTNLVYNVDNKRKDPFSPTIEEVEYSYWMKLQKLMWEEGFAKNELYDYFTVVLAVHVIEGEEFTGSHYWYEHDGEKEYEFEHP